jgi:opine dehydrogenase
MWRRDRDAVADHCAAGSTIQLKDFRGQHTASLERVTSDIGAAVSGAELILCPTPAFAQTDIAEQLAPHLVEGQVVFLPPGTFGSVLLGRKVWQSGNHARLAFAETGTLPWLARKHGPHEVQISARGKHLPTGVFPLALADHALEVIGRAFPGAIEPCGDALSGALMNAGPIIHPPLIVMNAGPLEHFEKWDIHNEGTQPALRRVTDALDRERVAIREALGYAARISRWPITMPQRDRNGCTAAALHEKLTKSGDWRERIVLGQHRYMLEDTRMGLSFFASVARLAGVATPLVDAFLAIGSAITGQDFAKTGRTLASLGMGGLDRAGLQALLREGFR